jgi:hypothetical protein
VRGQSAIEQLAAVNTNDSLTIIHILQGLEETDNISIATMKSYQMAQGYQRIFIWWRIDGVKKDYTRGMFTLDKTQQGVTGYSLDANRKHPKYHLLNDSEYIKSLLMEE